jgi:hypothetical protein
MYSEKNACLIAILSTTYPTFTALRSNSSLHDEKMATYRLSHGTLRSYFHENFTTFYEYSTICYTLSKVVYGVLRDVIYWPYHGVRYFLDIVGFHGKRVNEISFT